MMISAYGFAAKHAAPNSAAQRESTSRRNNANADMPANVCMPTTNVAATPVHGITLPRKVPSSQESGGEKMHSGSLERELAHPAHRGSKSPCYPCPAASSHDAI